MRASSSAAGGRATGEVTGAVRVFGQHTNNGQAEELADLISLVRGIPDDDGDNGHATGCECFHNLLRMQASTDGCLSRTEFLSDDDHDKIGVQGKRWDGSHIATSRIDHEIDFVAATQRGKDSSREVVHAAGDFYRSQWCGKYPQATRKRVGVLKQQANSRLLQCGRSGQEAGAGCEIEPSGSVTSRRVGLNHHNRGRGNGPSTSKRECGSGNGRSFRTEADDVHLVT